jgi:hypothetical protein
MLFAECSEFFSKWAIEPIIDSSVLSNINSISSVITYNFLVPFGDLGAYIYYSSYVFSFTDFNKLPFVHIENYDRQFIFGLM